MVSNNADEIFLLFSSKKMINMLIRVRIQLSITIFVALTPKINASPNWMARTDVSGIFFPISSSFVENPKKDHIIPVANPVDMTVFGCQDCAIATVPIVFCGWTGRGRLNRIPKTIFVIPNVRNIPLGLRPTIEIYPIIKGINVPQSPKAPPNSRRLNL